jgi:transcription antitermination factor NusB
MSATRGSMHDRRRAALQALYQFDCGRASEPEIVRAALASQAGSGASAGAADGQLAEPDPDSCHLSPDAIGPGFELAERAWEHRAEADRAVSELAADWPTHRQPTIDRAILRLAHYELTHAGLPAAVVIDEAVELAKAFGTEKSASFINAVLDKVAGQGRSVDGAQGSA